jgi:hypothetical protein
VGDGCSGTLECGSCPDPKTGCSEGGKCLKINGQPCNASSECVSNSCNNLTLVSPADPVLTAFYKVNWGADEPPSSICCFPTEVVSADGRCVPTNSTPLLAVPTGSSANDTWTLPTSEGWYDCDNGPLTGFGACSNICPVLIKAGENNVGEYTDRATTMCCGDDRKEFNKSNGGVLACCNLNSHCVDQDGNCVPAGSLWNGKVCSSCGWGTLDASYNNIPEGWYRGNIPKCISSGQFILDHLCGSEGSWTTRTGYIAGMMVGELEHKNAGYTVFCDNYTNALNYYDYNLNQDMNLLWHFLSPENGNCSPNSCYNNFCVMLNADGSVKAVGSSLNPDGAGNLDVNKVYLTLGLTGASCPTTGDSFASCGKGLRYNPVRGSFVYTKEQSGGFFAGVGNFLTQIINTFRNLLGGYQSTNPQDTFASIYGFKSPNLDRLYLLKSGGRSVSAFQERLRGTDRLLIDYSGFSTNICSELISNNELPALNCTSSSGHYRIYGSSSIASQSSITSVWIELTSKLRVS